MADKWTSYNKHFKKLQTKTDNLDRIKASAIQYENCPIATTTTTIITWPTAVPVWFIIMIITGWHIQMSPI